MHSKLISVVVNEEKYYKEIPVNRTLLEFIREDLGLTGAKEGCNEGECGACTVIMNGKPVNSCLVLAVEADGASILTIEGVSADGELHPLQQAFIEEGAVQCGYCTPGMILTAKAILDEFSNPSEDEIRKMMEGNLCRCTGYTRVIKTVKMVAEGPYSAKTKQENV
ncbi:MAG: (2Fe-2S)-binding protein [Spirochaetales bacterium]|jgi:carbon-monoxide dehydrogenase small subunit|nr:(2Fe-2S)-binding protein [Spirochaetales bacterium]